MTPTELEKKIEEAAHAYRDKSDVINEDWSTYSAFKSGAYFGREQGIRECIAKLRQEANLDSNVSCRMDMLEDAKMLEQRLLGEGK